MTGPKETYQPTNASLAERELLQKIAEGDTVAFRMLFDMYWPKIFANALKFTKSPEQAQDLAQEVFTKVWLTKEKLPVIERFDAYLFRIAKNAIFDFFDSKVLAPDNELYLAEYFDDIDNSPATKLELKELEFAINKAIAHLPDQVRMAFQLSRKEGLTHAEISRKMGISRVSSKSYISRAILSIKAYLSTNYQLLTFFFQIIAFHSFFLPSLLM